MTEQRDAKGRWVSVLLENFEDVKPQVLGIFGSAAERDAARAAILASHEEGGENEDESLPDLESHDVRLEGGAPSNKVYIVHSPNQTEDEHGYALASPKQGQVHGAFASKDEARAAQLAQAKTNWEGRGDEYDFMRDPDDNGPSEEQWDAAVNAWNAAHPDTPAPLSTESGKIPAGFEEFGSNHSGRTGKLPFPGVKAANEYFEDIMQPHLAIHLTPAKYKPQKLDDDSEAQMRRMFGMEKYREATPLAKLFSGLAGLFGKDDPGGADVHVDVPLGADGKPRKKKPSLDALKFDKATVCKVDAEHGLVFGYAIVSKENGEPYFDVQGDHIDEGAMLGAAIDFMENSRVAKEMHTGDERGSVVFAFPLTSDIAKALDIVTPKTGLLIAMKPDADMLAKFKSGEFTGFSIGGSRITDEDVE